MCEGTKGRGCYQNLENLEKGPYGAYNQILIEVITPIYKGT